MDTSVIIVTYNSSGVLGPCLDSLRKQNPSGGLEVIVVDNASADGTEAMVRERYPWVKLIPAGRNLGFSSGVNVGIREAQGRYLLILNPDTVVREGAVETLIRFMDATPDAGIVGPKLVFHDGNLQYSCRRFYNWRVLLLRRTFLGRIFKSSKAVSEHLMLDFDHESVREVDWLLGACLLVRREAVKSVGLMDERFFLYFEDVDWCYRMHQKGWKVYYNPEAVVVHDYARDSAQSVLNRSFVAHLASLVRYYEKWNFVLYLLKKYREVLKILLFLFVDLIAFNLAFLCAYYTRIALGGIFTNPLFPITAYDRFVFYENLLFVFTYFAAGLYRVRRDTSYVDELFNIGRAIILASILLMAGTYISHVRTYSRMVVAFLVPYAVIFDWGLRSLIRRAHRNLLAQKIDLKRVCIIGPAEEARRLELRLSEEERLGIEVVGIVSPAGEGGDDGQSLGALSELEHIIDLNRIQELIVLPGAVDEERLAGLVVLGRRRLLDVTVLTDYSGLVIHQAKIRDMAGRPVIAYPRDTGYAVDRIAKRLLDIALGSVFLLVSAPICVLYSLYAALRGRAAFHRDQRLGADGRPFSYPIAGTRSPNGPSDIVNLPLFWLVVIGKMSMVGPYPLAAEEARRVEEAASFRFALRPGVTGYWRIGTGTTVAAGDILAQDASYARNWSLLQDIKILVTTFGNVLAGRRRSLTFTQQP